MMFPGGLGIHFWLSVLGLVWGGVDMTYYGMGSVIVNSLVAGWGF